MNIKRKWLIIAVLLLALAQIAYESIFRVTTGEQVLLARFGKVEKGPITEPGYYLKFYRFDQIVRYPISVVSIVLKFSKCSSRQLPPGGIVKFTITDPLRFYQTINKIESLSAIVSGSIMDKYCREHPGEPSEAEYLDPSDFVVAELSKWGVTVEEISFRNKIRLFGAVWGRSLVCEFCNQWNSFGVKSSWAGLG